MWKNSCRRDAMFFRPLHKTKRGFSCPGWGQGAKRRQPCGNKAVVCHNTAQMYSPRVAFAVREASPIPGGVDWGHWEPKAKRAGGPQHRTMCSLSCQSVGITIDVSFAGSKVQGMTCLSLQVFFWQAGRVVRFPSWLLKSQVREPEGGKAAAAKPSPLCFHLRDIPWRDSYIVKLFSKVPVSVIAHGFVAKVFPCLLGLHANSRTQTPWDVLGRLPPHGSQQCGWGCAQPGHGELWLCPHQPICPGQHPVR